MSTPTVSAPIAPQAQAPTLSRAERERAASIARAAEILSEWTAMDKVGDYMTERVGWANMG